MVMFYACICERVCVLNAHRCESVLKNVCICMVNRCVRESLCVCVCVRESIKVLPNFIG